MFSPEILCSMKISQIFFFSWLKFLTKYLPHPKDLWHEDSTSECELVEYPHSTPDVDGGDLRQVHGDDTTASTYKKKYQHSKSLETVQLALHFSAMLRVAGVSFYQKHTG